MQESEKKNQKGPKRLSRAPAAAEDEGAVGAFRPIPRASSTAVSVGVVV